MLANLFRSLRDSSLFLLRGLLPFHPISRLPRHFGKWSDWGERHVRLSHAGVVVEQLLFFADRFHLRKYGRPVSECEYFAMNNGPVASEAKRVAEERLPEKVLSYARRYIRRKDNFRYGSVGEVDDAVLSQSDIEALDFAWKNFGHYTEFDLAEITHHYPEWKRQAAKLRRAGPKRVEMHLADFLDEPDPGYNPCHELTKKDREIARELYLDSETISSI